MANGILILEDHPVQYHAPVYRCVQQTFGIPITVAYESDSSLVGGHDTEFGTGITWDTDLLSGYSPRFLSRDREPAKRRTPLTLRLRQTIQEVSPEMIMVTGYAKNFDRAAIVASQGFRGPLIFRAETTDHARNRSQLKSALRDGALRLLYRRFQKLLYIGTRSLQHYQRLGCPVEKLQFSPYCVDTAPFLCSLDHRQVMGKATRRTLSIESSQIVLLFSGKLSHRKGPDLLLDAVRKLDEKLRSQITVIFMGSGDLSQSLQDQAARLGLASQVCFVGFQNQSALSKFYNAADCLVLPSRHSETWGLVVNEALHHGLPCVVSEAVGSGSDLIEAGKSGEVFTTGSVESLAQAIARVLTFLKVPATRESCWQKVSAYSVSAAAKGIAAAYDTTSGTGRVAPQL